MKVNRYLILLFFIFFAIIILLLPFKYLLHYSVDDSYFYIKTANNFAGGLGSTFDTINKTNGYHPLWFILLSIYYFIIHLLKFTSPELIYRYTFLLSSLLNLISLYLLFQFYKNIFGKSNVYVFIIIIPLLLSFSLFHVIGLESQLLILLLSLYIFYDTIKINNLNYLIKAIILGLIVITRLDLIIFTYPIIIFYEIIKERNYSIPNKIKNYQLLIITPLIFYLFYELANYIGFSSLLTISGKIKFSVLNFLFWKNIPNIHEYPINFFLLSINISSGIIYYTLIKKNYLLKDKIKNFRIIEYLYWSGNLFLLFHFCFNNQGVRLWYYAFPNFISLILVSPMILLLKKIRTLLISVSVIILILFLTLFRINYYNSDDEYSYALKMKKIVSKGENVFQVDYTGIIGFYSERNVINGDGLINSFEYYKYLQNNNLKSYFKKLNIKYYSTISFNPIIVKDYFYDSVYHPDGLTLKFPIKNIVIKCQKIYGGIFRKRYGWFYLIKIDGSNLF